MTLADQILSFQKKLRLNIKLPKGILAMNPYQDEIAFSICEKFYQRFYADESPRTIILGINPGRHGGGISDSDHYGQWHGRGRYHHVNCRHHTASGG